MTRLGQQCRFDLLPLHDTKHASAPGNNPNNNH